MRRRGVTAAGVVLASLLCASALASDPLPTYSRLILASISEIEPRPYCWGQRGEGCRGEEDERAGTGLSRPVSLRSRRGRWRLQADARGASHCVGATYEAVAPVLSAHGLAAGASGARLETFQMLWYAVCPAEDDEGWCHYPDGSRYRRERLVQEAAALAIGHLGVGKRVSPQRARPGDVLQLRRDDGGGHSAILLGFVQADGSRAGHLDEHTVGARYFSSQRVTGGHGERVECFVKAGACPQKVCGGRCELDWSAVSAARVTGPRRASAPADTYKHQPQQRQPEPGAGR